MSQGAAWTRRSALGLGGAGLAAGFLPARVQAAAGNTSDVALRKTLDGLSAMPDPAAQFAALVPFANAQLSRSSRLDLDTVLFALAIQRKQAELPASASRYPLQLALACGASVEPAQAKARLTAEVAWLEAIAERQFARLGMTRGTLGERFVRLLADPRYAYTDSNAGRDRAVADMNRWLGRARNALPRWFDPLPPRCLDVAVRRLTPAEIAAGKGGYRTLPTATARGYYIVDLKDIARRPSWTLHSVVHHELLPGHMIQLPMQQLAGPHPLRLHYTSGFTEGWAVHAEYLAWQGGLITDPAGQLGTVHWLLFRMTRGLADLALNGAGQAPEQVIAMLQARLGFPVYFAPFEEDLAKMTRAPGVRVAEALTALQIGSAMRHSGHVRRFHQSMLVDGPLPLRLIR